MGETQYFAGELEVQLTPQGTLAERMRAAGAGIPAFFTPTGYGTLISTGGYPIRQKGALGDEIPSEAKETRTFGDTNYVMETALHGDYALVKAWKGDTLGNLVFRSTANNFNGVMPAAGKICIAEVEELVEPGEIAPEEVHVPSIYVQRIFQGKDY